MSERQTRRALFVGVAAVAAVGGDDFPRQIGHAIAHELHRCIGGDGWTHSWACDQATAIARRMLYERYGESYR